MTANNLLEPSNHALLLIDHQYLQLLTLGSHEASQVISNATAVAKAARIFKVPTAAGYGLRGASEPHQGDPGRLPRTEAD